MDKTTQPFLPKIKRVSVVVKERKSPEPEDISQGIIRKYEIQYRPFDLKFRGRLSGWLNEYRKEIGNIVDPPKQKIIEMYLFKYNNKWLTQAEIAGNLNLNNSRLVSKMLRESLGIIWERIHIK